MFKKLNPHVINAYAETRQIFDREQKKLEVKAAIAPLSEEDEKLKQHLTDMQNLLLIEEMNYITKNVNNPKRFWKKIFAKVS